MHSVILKSVFYLYVAIFYCTFQPAFHLCCFESMLFPLCFHYRNRKCIIAWVRLVNWTHRKESYNNNSFGLPDRLSGQGAGLTSSTLALRSSIKQNRDWNWSSIVCTNSTCISFHTNRRTSRRKLGWFNHRPLWRVIAHWGTWKTHSHLETCRQWGNLRHSNWRTCRHWWAMICTDVGTRSSWGPALLPGSSCTRVARLCPPRMHRASRQTPLSGCWARTQARMNLLSRCHHPRCY